MWLPADLLRNSRSALPEFTRTICVGPALRDLQGLTLVELLLSLTLFTGLLGSVAALVLSGLNVQRTWGQSVEPYERLERAMSRFERDLTTAQPFFGVPAVVEADRVEIARVARPSAPSADTAPEWLRIVYRLADTTQGRSLIREEYLWKEGAGQEPLQQEALLPVENGQFAFGMVNAQTGQLEWATAWNGAADGMPRLVTCDLTLRAVGAQPPLHLSRVVRNPSGTLPTVGGP